MTAEIATATMAIRIPNRTQGTRMAPAGKAWRLDHCFCITDTVRRPTILASFSPPGPGFPHCLARERLRSALDHPRVPSASLKLWTSKSLFLLEQPNGVLILAFAREVQRYLAVPTFRVLVGLVGKQQCDYFGLAKGSGLMKWSELALAVRGVHVRAIGEQDFRDFDVAESGREVQGSFTSGRPRPNQGLILCQHTFEQIGSSREGGHQDVSRLRATREEHLDRGIKVVTQLRRSTSLQVFDIWISLPIQKSTYCPVIATFGRHVQGRLAVGRAGIDVGTFDDQIRDPVRFADFGGHMERRPTQASAHLLEFLPALLIGPRKALCHVLSDVFVCASTN